ncbi:MAG TPA: hypothetical protein VMJ92_03720 [Candidatus Limnocylindrales bacterium]|nr:hypothetical protein [Candidatus Limnocylindrales bacterium]
MRAATLLIALSLLVGACSTPAPDTGPRDDVADAAALGRRAAALLTRFSAYDYALAGTLSGESTHVVPVARYGEIVRQATGTIAAITADTIAATVDANGPLRDRLVVLADSLIELSRDANAFADGADPAVFAEVVGDVEASWGLLRALQAQLTQPDQAIDAALAAASAISVSASAETVHVVTLGPFGGAEEAQAAARQAGPVERVDRDAPFVVRVSTHADLAAAEAAVGELAGRGLTARISEDVLYVFSREGEAPAGELWREPARVIDVHASARRLAIAPDALWIAAGSDDGTLAIFSGDGILRSLPKYNSGVAHLAFSDDGRWLMGGGLVMANFTLPLGLPVGTQVRLPGVATDFVYIPGAYAYAASSKGPTGEAAGGGGAIAGRAPDGAVLGPPFPLTTPASGALLAATRLGELYIGTTGADGGGVDVEVFKVGLEREVRGVVRVPGAGQRLAIDPDGILGAIVTDQGTFRFGPHDVDPTGTLHRVADPARDIAFADGRFYVLMPDRLIALDLLGNELWTAPLVDARKLVVASRVLVQDGAERIVAFDADGNGDDLGTSGTIQDLAASPDGRYAGAIVDGRGAVLFRLP